MNTDGSCLLGDADDRALDLLVGHHEVGKLVDDEHHVGHLTRDASLLLFGVRTQAVAQLLELQAVVGADVAAARLGEQLVPLVHLLDRPLQDRCCPVHLGDDRAHQVRDVLELAHLDHLGVDQNQLELVGLLRVEEAHDDRVHAHRLARARRARDEHVRHLGQVLDERIARGVLAQEHRELHLRELLALGHQLAQAHPLLRRVGHLDADRVATDLVGNDADVDRLERTRQVARDARQLADLRARGQLDVVERDHRARLDAHNLARDAVLAQGALKRLGLLAHKALERVAEVVVGLFEQVETGELVPLKLGVVLQVRQVLVGCYLAVGARKPQRQLGDLLADRLLAEHLRSAGDLVLLQLVLFFIFFVFLFVRLVLVFVLVVFLVFELGFLVLVDRGNRLDLVLVHLDDLDRLLLLLAGGEHLLALGFGELLLLDVVEIIDPGCGDADALVRAAQDAPDQVAREGALLGDIAKVSHDIHRRRQEPAVHRHHEPEGHGHDEAEHRPEPTKAERELVGHHEPDRATGQPRNRARSGHEVALHAGQPCTGDDDASGPRHRVGHDVPAEAGHHEPDHPEHDGPDRQTKRAIARPRDPGPDRTTPVLGRVVRGPDRVRRRVGCVVADQARGHEQQYDRPKHRRGAPERECVIELFLTSLAPARPGFLCGSTHRRRLSAVRGFGDSGMTHPV